MGDRNNDLFSMESCIAEANSLTEATLQKLFSLWDGMYEMTDEKKRQRGVQFVKHLTEFYADMYRCEKTKEVNLQNDVLSIRKKISELGKDLKVTINTEMPADTPLKNIVESLSAIMEEYKEIKEKRMSRLNCLKNEENNLCNLLEMDPLPSPTGTPSDEELGSLDHHIFELQEIKMSRTEEFNENKEHVARLLHRLELGPRNSFETELLNSTTPSDLSRRFLDRVKDCLHSVEEAYKVNEDQVMLLWSQLESMWMKIDEDKNLCDRFREKHKGVGASVLSAIKAELDRCIKVRAANLDSLLVRAKRNIREMWDQMTYSEDQRQYFQPYFTDHCSEDILDLLEIETERLRDHYAANIEIYRLAEKREELWERMMHLYALAQDKNRLFNNRGGQLLREEKERKTIDVNLPKIDKQLQQHIAVYQDKYRTPFMWHGRDLLEKINSDWEEQEAIKKNKKMERKAKNAKTVELEARLGTQASTTKRKICTTNSSTKSNDATANKLMKMESTTIFNRTNVYSQEKRKPDRRFGEAGTPLVAVTPCRSGSLDSIATDASYSLFMGEIEDRLVEGEDRLLTSERRALRDINAMQSSTPTPALLGTPRPLKRPPVLTPGAVTPKSRLIRTPRTASATRVTGALRPLSARSCFNLKF